MTFAQGTSPFAERIDLPPDHLARLTLSREMLASVHNALGVLHARVRVVARARGERNG
jgi:hypothetical protein